MKIRLAVDQDAVMPSGHVAVCLLKLAEAADRQAVEIAGRNVMLVGVVPFARTLEQPRQAIVGIGKARLPSQEPPILLNARRGIGRLVGASGQKLKAKRLANRARGRCRQE